LIPPEHRGDTPIVAVSPDPLEKFKNIIPIVTDRTGRQFLVTLLSDAQLGVIDRYGLRNEEAAKRGMNLPHPTTYVIDKTGRVRWKFTEKNYAVRPTDEMILAELKKLW
jgi:peroxiredoxin